MTMGGMPRLGSRIALPLVVALLSLAPPAHAATEDPEALDRRGAGVGATGVDLELVGRGFGHGTGLSQYGALGRANAGQTYRQIVSFYYPGTGWGRAGGKIRVLITADSTDDVVVRDASGLTVRALDSGKTWSPRIDADRWRIKPRDGRSVISYRTGRWHEWRDVRGNAEFTAAGPLRLITPDGATPYRGALRSTGGDTVNVLPLDTYLRGVVPREVPALWPGAAVRAQAVAARTYAAYERAHGSGHYDLCDTAHCQVYGGVVDEHDASDAAIAATAHVVRVEGGEPIFAQFSASNGGHSTQGPFDYLPAQADPVDLATYDEWQQTVSGSDIGAWRPAIGTFESLTVDERDGRGSYGGRVVRLTLHGSAGDVQVTGDQFRIGFGLRSTLFDLAPAG